MTAEKKRLMAAMCILLFCAQIPYKLTKKRTDKDVGPYKGAVRVTI